MVFEENSFEDGLLVSESTSTTLSGRSSDQRVFRDLTSAIAASTSTSFAVFLTGALAVQMRTSLHFGPDALGFSISLYYLGAAIGSMPFGRLAEAIGGIRVMRPSAVLAAVILMTVATLVHSWIGLTVVLFFAGLLSAAMQPATNLFLARRIPSDKQGFAFGVKQAAIPLAALLAGLAVPVIALTIGWRWAFVSGALLSLGAAFSIPRSQTTLAAYRAQHRYRPHEGDLLPLVVLSIGFGMSVFAASGLTAFLVTSGVASGISKADAGLVAGIAGAAALISRVVSGILADRRGKSHFQMVSIMLSVGFIGFMALAVGSSTGIEMLFVLGAIVAFGAGWGWNGLFNYAVIRTHSDSPARATAVTQVGGRLAGVFGPLGFGLIVAHGSYSIAWAVDGVMVLLGAGVIIYGRWIMLRTA